MTFGTLQFEEKKPRGRYRIKAEPHVIMRLKRLFARVEVERADILVADTAEVGRELVWFMGRFPLDMDATTRERVMARDREDREREAAIGEVLAGTYQAPAARELAVPLRDYQKTAAALVLRTGRLLLGDQLGLGKTASAIGVLADPRALPALVVTKTDLPHQWEREINRFAPFLRTHVLRKARPYALDEGDPKRGRRKAQAPLPGMERATGMPDVIITSYSKIAGWAGELAGKVRTVIWDEAQELRTGVQAGRSVNLKNAGAQLLANHATYRMGLSGTPIYNYGEEYWHVVQCIAPDALGTVEEFRREWCKTGPGGKYLVADERAFGTYMRSAGLLLRRTRKDVKRELPGADEPQLIPVEIDADLGALAQVELEVADLARTILAQGGIKGFEKMEAAREFDMKMRQATGIAKAPYVANLVRMIVENGEKVLLFGWHHAVYDIWLSKLRDLRPVMFTGRESQSQKAAALRDFIEGDAKVMIMSVRAGAGIDGLQKVCHVTVHGELDWSSGVIDQDIGRVARDGQEDVVLAYIPFTTGGTDPVMLDVLGIKRRQLDLTIDPDKPNVAPSQADPERIRKLAASVLERRGLAAPVAQSEAAAAIGPR